jgi:hypothetical protein
VITAIRCRETPSYLAKFASGATEDFCERVPDSSPEFAKIAAKLEQTLTDAKARCTAARSSFRRAIEARENAESVLARASLELEEVRSSAGAATTKQVGVESEASGVETALAKIEPGVPELLRRTPPRWSLWLWLLRFWFEVMGRRVLARYRALARRRLEIHAQLSEGRREVAARTEEQSEAEARLEQLSANASRAESHAGDAERALRAAEKECDGILAELAALRSEQEHHESERRRRFLDDIRDLCGQRGRKLGLVELSIDYPARLLPSDVTIIDVPGTLAEGTPQWNAIREEVDGCILVSELDRAVSESAKRLLRWLRDVVPHLLLVLTKVDQAFAKAVGRGDDDPWERVEQARRIGTRRFARELGREPESVLSIAVSAEGALRPEESELTRRFEAEMAKLFHLLRHERALILGARAAGAIRRCIGGTTEAELRAERAYRERIEDLERKRMPSPESFTEERLTRAEDAIGAAARAAVTCGILSVEQSLPTLKGLTTERLHASTGTRGLAERLCEELSEKAAGVRSQARLEIEAGIEKGIRTIVGGLFEDVRRQYGLLPEVEHSSDSSRRLGAPDGERPQFVSLVSDIRDAFHSFERQRYLLGASGVFMGATAGAFVHPWLGGVGAIVGVLLAFARRKTPVHEQTSALAATALAGLEQQYVEEVRALTPAAASAIRAASRRSLERAIVRLGRSITEPIESEQQAIDEQRKKLCALEGLKAKLAHHDRELERLLEVAADASVGLCR